MFKPSPYRIFVWMTHQRLPFISWIKLSRPANLVMVILCCLCVRLLWWQEQDVDWMACIGFMAIAVLVTAGGNILNDYYDVRVDKLNRPNKILLAGSAQRKQAILAHVILTSIALIMAAFMSYTFGWRLVIIPLLTSIFLWWYSPVLKKKFLVGNALVALCVGILPLWSSLDLLPALVWDTMTLAGKSTYFLSICALLLTLAREIVKDLEDAPGDRAVGYKTLALLWPAGKSKMLVHGLNLTVFLCTLWFSLTMLVNDIITASAIVLSGIPLLTASVFLHRAQQPTEYGKASRWLKWASLGGILFIVLNAFLQKYASGLV
ncbi:MAG: geranylgeranylglycerol-phosphate geranylgeranyltransferase [Flavobacteriales bacterium]